MNKNNSYDHRDYEVVTGKPQFNTARTKLLTPVIQEVID